MNIILWFFNIIADFKVLFLAYNLLPIDQAPDPHCFGASSTCNMWPSSGQPGLCGTSQMYSAH